VCVSTVEPGTESLPESPHRNQYLTVNLLYIRVNTARSGPYSTPGPAGDAGRPMRRAVSNSFAMAPYLTIQTSFIFYKNNMFPTRLDLEEKVPAEWMIDGALFVGTFRHKIESTFTYRQRTHVVGRGIVTKAITFYQEMIDHTIRNVPIFGACQLLGIERPERKAYELIIPLVFTGELTDGQGPPQIKTLHIINEQLRTVCGAILSMPRTIARAAIVAAIITSRSQRTLIIVRTQEAISRWKGVIEKWVDTGQGEPPTIHILSTLSSNMSGDINIIILSELATGPMKLSVGLCILDEADKVNCHQLSKAMCSVQFQASLGLVSKPTRVDGCEMLIQHHMGNVVFTWVTPDSDRVTVLRVAMESRGSIIHYPNGALSTPRIITSLCSNGPRNACLVSICGYLRHTWPKRRVLVLSDRVKHAHTLADEYGVGSSVFSTKSQKTISDIIGSGEDGMLIMSTFPIASTGLDIQDLSIIVLACPKSAIENICDSLFQKSSAEQVLIVDINDTYTVFKNMANRRERYFTKCGYKLKNITQEGILSDPVVIDTNNKRKIRTAACEFAMPDHIPDTATGRKRKKSVSTGKKKVKDIKQNKKKKLVPQPPNFNQLPEEGRSRPEDIPIQRQAGELRLHSYLANLAILGTVIGNK
jgi:hypothetical protein